MRRRFFALFLVGLILIAAGCGQSGNAAPSDATQILPAESVDTGNLFLLERMEHAFLPDGEEASIALYTSAQVASDGQMGWDTGDQWTLLVQQEGQLFVLLMNMSSMARSSSGSPTSIRTKSKARDPLTWSTTSM